MKIQIFTLFFFLCFVQIGVGQTEPLIQKYKRYSNSGPGTDFWLTVEREYTYDFQNKLTFKELKGFSDPGVILYWRGSVYEYDVYDRLKKYTYKRYNPDVDLWITISWIDYKYDPNGCLYEETTYSNVGGLMTRRITYTRNEDCQMTSEFTEWLANGIDLSPKDLYTRVYHADERSYDEKFFRQSFTADSMYLAVIRKNIIGEDENILEEYQTVLTAIEDTFFHTKIFSDYDEHKNITLRTSYYKDQYTDGWELNSQRTFNNEYDENGFLVGKKTEQWQYDDPNPPHENLFYRQNFIYKNTCEGINEEYTVNYGDTGKDVRYEFIYQGVNNCLDVEKLDLQISISPNPSNGKIEMTSSIFKTGNTDILIFSTDGKVLLQKNENSRCETSFLDLTLLQNGIYILQLQNGKHFINEKLVIAN